ncbi:hypothetical protein [Streptomyces sp. CdTB01]|uniref:hypothetical protein n=1 Tax=Streptomyces sp. CdTB01 TaxID=1725411 RepID=UPI00131F31E9|nr:hypothetical protein [Streptomyces sp. CdTB01]
MLTLIATLLGTVAGALATLGAAIASGRFQRESAQIAARAQLHSDRRQPRHDAYKSVLETATKVSDRVDQDSYDDTTAEEENALKEAIASVDWVGLSLLGPEPIIATGAELRGLCLRVTSCMWRTRVLGQRHIRAHEEDGDIDTAERAYSAAVDEIYELGRLLAESIKAFSVSASAVLNDDGTEEPRQRWRWRGRQ